MKVTHRVRVGSDIEMVAAGAGSIWVGTDDFDDLLRIDPPSGEIVARIRYAGRYSGASQLAFSGSDVWAAVPGAASPPGGFDPGSPPEPWLVKAYEDFRLRTADLLEEETGGGIVRFDASTGRVRREMLFLDYRPSSIVMTDAGPVVPTDRGLRRLDPDTYRFGPPIGEPEMNFTLGTDEGIWAWSRSRIVLLDDETLQAKLTITAQDARVAGEFEDIAIDGGVLWILSQLEILKVDASTGAVLARTDSSDLFDIEARYGIVLVEEILSGDLHRIDPSTLETVATLDLPDKDVEAYGLAIDVGAAWIAHGSSVLRVSVE
jgi:hypothetical protein